jgi:hypothetical protein
MRAGLVVSGLVLIIVGILMMLMFWPLIGYETKNTFDIEDAEEGDRIRYVGTITSISEYGEWKVIELDYGVLDYYTKDKQFEKNDIVVVGIEFGDNASNWDENEYLEIENVPTLGGLLGLLLLIIGFVVMVAGSALKKRTLEDVLKFQVEPAAEIDKMAPPQISNVQQPQASQEGGHIKSDHIQYITCPGCKHVFGLKGLARPAKIACPKCGLKGILD